MSFDARNNSALMKRADQVRRWEESDTNLEPSVPKNEKGRKIKFSSGCVFLAACVSGDKDEVRRLIDSGADINTANVDGLTALHQACIDDNLDMVEFLVEQGADINRQDNEGWTPLHATSSCGFVSIARYLVQNGADLTAVNSDGELAFDLASTNAMADYLQGLIDEYSIDCEKARQQEEQLMLNDAKKWLRSDASEADKPHPKTGATALHVAAAKGYTKVLSLLLAGRANVDKQDNDGWTPLHAAAHWGQKEAAEMLVDALADMDTRNYAGQTPIDVADKKILKFLEELKINNKRTKRRPSSQIRISDSIENHTETPTKLIRVEVKSDTQDKSNEDVLDSLKRITESEETDSDLTDSTESSHSTSISEGLEDTSKPSYESANPILSESGDEDAPWRRSGSARSRNQIGSPPKTQVQEKEVKTSESEVILRRTQSFENDEKFYQKYNELRARIKANSCPILPASQSTGVIGAVNTPNSYSVQRSASLKDHRHLRKPVSPPVSPCAPVATPNSAQVRSHRESDDKESNKTVDLSAERKNETKSNDSNSFRSKISPGTLFKNFFKSFVPPVRDEESETQRKAHAKRVRETRRSTQGVTLDEIKSAEELVKRKNLNNNNNSNNDIQNPPSSTTAMTTTISPIMKITVNDQILPTLISTSDDVIIETKPSCRCEEISASNTIPAPIFKKLRDTSNEDNSRSSNISELIAPPTATIISCSPANGGDQKLENVKEILANVLTADNVPISSNKNENLEELTKTGKPTVVYTHEKNNSTSTMERINITNPEENDSKRIRDKRSLFDIDNANSLTLAEKLRNEANKYSEASNTSEIVVNENADKEYLSRKSDSAPSSPLHQSTAERRPSWRLKFDSGSKFKLEDATSAANFPANNSTIITSAPAVIAAANLSSAAQKRNISTSITTPAYKPLSAPTTSDGTENSIDNVKDAANEVTVTLRRNKTNEDKENDKENDGRNIQAVQAVIQRRRKPKRRSTGVVHLDMDEIDPEKQDSLGDNEEKEPTPPRQRTLSSSRTPSTYYSGNTGYSSRPLSTGYYTGSQPSVYQSPYAHTYGSRDNLYNHSSRNGYYSNGAYDSRYKTNSFGSDRYMSPYSSFDKGVTTAGLSLSMPGKGYVQKPSTYSNKSKNSNKNDFNAGRDTNLIKAKISVGTNTPTSLVVRSQSLRDQERKSRSRSRNRSAEARSLSASSEKSEGYESGSERTARLRVDSTTSLYDTEQGDNKSSGKDAENGDVIDYKALWEAGKVENEKLRKELKKKDDELTNAKASMEKYTNTATKNSLSELEKRERRAMERKLSEMEEELKHLDILKSENQRLKEENGALIRVISKLSK